MGRGGQFALATQNVDGLHQEAGSKNVIEFHGNVRRLVCLKCGKTYPVEDHANAPFHTHDFRAAPYIPHCECGAVLKPDATLFGERLPPDAAAKAFAAIDACDCVLIVGTSGLISPANLLPEMAKKHGAVVIEVNPEPTPYTAFADVFLQGAAGVMLPEIVPVTKR